MLNANLRELNRTLKKLKDQRSDIEHEINDEEKKRNHILNYIRDLEKQLITAMVNFLFM